MRNELSQAGAGAELARRAVEVFRARASEPLLNQYEGSWLQGRYEGMLRALREGGVHGDELVAVAGADLAQVLLAVLAVWSAGATPCLGTGAAQARMQLVDGNLTRGSGEAVSRLKAALVSVEPLIGAIAYPEGALQHLQWPALPSNAQVCIGADWRADIWLPLCLQALLSPGARVSLRHAGGGMAPEAGAWLACPLASLPAGDADLATLPFCLSWGSGVWPAKLAKERHQHALGDHMVLGVASHGQARGKLFGRHRICNPKGQVLPDNAWGLLALAGELPSLSDELSTLQPPIERTWLSEYAARKRADGSVEFDTAHQCACEYAGRRMREGAVNALLAKHVRGDAVLLARDAGEARQRLVVYASERVDLNALQQALPDWARPLGLVVLPRLPRTSAGAMDLDHLIERSPPDSWLLEDVARRLGAGQSGAGVELRVRMLPAQAPAPALPSMFLPQGSAYPDGGVAQIDGPHLEVPAGNLVDRLVAAAEGDRGLVFIDGDGGQRNFSYRQLLDAAARVAALLQARGVTAETEVIVHCDDPQSLLSGIWACILIGALPVPLIPASPYEAASNPLWHLLGAESMLKNRAVLLSRDQQSRTSAALTERGLLAGLIDIESAGDLAPLPSAHWQCSANALMLLTSGSTGQPKGVVLTHSNLLSLSKAVSQTFGFEPNEVSLNWLALDHVGGLVQHHLRDLCLGYTQLHVQTAFILASPPRMLDLIDQHRVSLLWMANFGFNLMNEHALSIAAGRWDLSCVKLWENGGESVTPDSCQRFLAMLAVHGLGTDVIKPVFGMTETTSACIGANNFRLGSAGNVHWLSETSLDAAALRCLPGDGSPFVEVGRPFPGTSVRVVDAHGKLCAEGVIGRIEVCGAQIMAGYHRNGAANEESFTADGWLRMGDCGFIVDGQLVVTGREKDIVIVNGLNHSARALESSIEAVRGVRTGCCAAISVRKADDVTDKLVVFYSDGPIAAEPLAIESALVAEHGLRPAALVRLKVESWPRTAIGKIRRQVLAAGFLAGDFADSICLQRDSSLGERASLPDWQFQLDWERVVPSPARAGRRTLCLGQRGDAIGGLYAQAGTAFSGFDAADDAHYQQDCSADLVALLNAAAHRLGGLDLVVDLRFQQEPGTDAARSLAESCSRWGQLLAAAAQLAAPPEIVLACSEAFVVDGEEAGISQAALPGVAASLAQAHGGLRVRLVDGAAAQQLLCERTEPGFSVRAYRHGLPLAPMLRPVQAATLPEQPHHVLKASGHYLVVGGLGGLGAHLCLHLLRQFKARLLVVGRRSLVQDSPAALLMQQLREQCRDGASIDYASLDASDAQALATALQRAEGSWGAPLDAAFQLAGEGSVLERLAELDASDGHQQALRRAATRIGIAEALEQALGERKAALLAFSSVNGWFGGTGFTEYSGACAYQSSQAQWLQRRGVRQCFSLDWSMWNQIGMAAQVPAQMKELALRRGFATLSASQGLASLHLALNSPAGRNLIGLNPGAELVQRLLDPHTLSYEIELNGDVDATRAASLLGVAAASIRSARKQAAGAAAVALDGAQLEALLSIFREVLVRPDFESSDNFFASGGDSIRAIQLVSRAGDLGLRFSPLDLFEHQTVASLLAHVQQQRAASAAEMADEELDVQGPVPVPPIFSWWLERSIAPQVRNHFSMGVRYRLKPAVSNPTLVRAALLGLIERHEALRLVLSRSSQSWSFTISTDAQRSLAFEYCEQLQDPNADGALDSLERRLHAGLDLEAGRLVNAALVPLDDGSSQLLLVIHHAVVDGVSWRIIEEELRELVEAQAAGRPPALAAGTLGFKAWCQRLAARARRVDGANLADAWYKRLQAVGQPLAAIDSLQYHEARTKVASRSLSVEALRMLGDASLYESLLAAVGWKLSLWLQSASLLLDVEGHGRLNGSMPEDIGRTVGWFTSIAPMRLDFTGCRSAADALPRVRQATQSLRGRDLEWGMLQYMGACPEAHALQQLPARKVSFNYLGSFDSSSDRDAALLAIPNSMSAEQHADAVRPYLLDIAAHVADWTLHLAVKYSPELHDALQIDRLLDDCLDQLKALLNAPSQSMVSSDQWQLALAEVAFEGMDQ